MPLLHLDDVDLYYETCGDGPPFLFCSATATHGEVWKLCQIPEFSRDHMVITYDQRGTGRSLVRSTDFSTQRLTADAAALLNAVAARPAIVCGHSNGGRVAQLLALDYQGKVKKVILASSGGMHGSKGIPLAMCLGLVEKGYAAYVRDQAIANGFTRDFVENYPDRVERFLDVRLGNPPPLEIFLHHVIARQNYDSGNRLREIAVPTLVLVGDDEDHGPPGHTTHRTFAESLAREIPGAKLIVLEGQAHYYYYSDAETTNRAIRQFIAAT